MAMGGMSKWKDVKSPEAIEEGIKSIKTVTWDPFTVFPKEIYMEIFEKLESSVDKQNFMNAHVKWKELFKSKRTLFLCPQVFEEMNRYEEENLDWEGFKDRGGHVKYHQCRLVCHDWDRSVQKVFQMHEHYFTLTEDKHYWIFDLPTIVYHEREHEPCTIFMWFRIEDLETELEMFSVTHPPPKNPFFSRSIALFPFSDGVEVTSEELQRYRNLVDTMLERYGRHFWHCEFNSYQKLDPEACLQMAKWLSLMPELKTLHLKYNGGEDNPFSTTELKAIEDMQMFQPEMKNLVVLKSSYLPALVFNKLFGKLPRLEKIQLKILKGKESLLKDFELGFEPENMKEAVLTLKGFDDFNHLLTYRPFPALNKLAIMLEYVDEDEREYRAYSKWPEWKMIWEILEEKFPSLEELCLRLPKAFSIDDRRAAIHQSLECRLKLPKLKKLWVALPNLSCIDFILPCKALKELEVNLEHSEWKYSKRSEDLGRSEGINLNVDLKNMWESNIWGVFPKLYKLKVCPLPESNPVTSLDEFTYEKCGDVRKYRAWTSPH